MPSRRERQFGEGGVDDGTVAVRLVEAVIEEELSAPGQGGGDFGSGVLAGVDLGEGFEGRDSGVERAVAVTEANGSAISAAVGQLVGKEPLHCVIDARVVEAEATSQGRVHGDDAGLGGVDRGGSGEPPVEVPSAAP